MICLFEKGGYGALLLKQGRERLEKAKIQDKPVQDEKPTALQQYLSSRGKPVTGAREMSPGEKEPVASYASKFRSSVGNQDTGSVRKAARRAFDDL